MNRQQPVSISGMGCICAAGKNLPGCMEALFTRSPAPAPPHALPGTQHPVFEVPDGFLPASDSTKPAHGASGSADLILGTWSQYLEGTYQTVERAESIHVRFLEHERVFKFWLRNAGAPWWSAALTPKKGADTLSPFVVLGDAA